jgi:hypothetical protein
MSGKADEPNLALLLGIKESFRRSVGHEKNALTFSFQGASHPAFRLAPMIFPAIVEKCHSTLQGTSHNLLGNFLIFRISQMVLSESERRDFNACFAELPSQDGLCLCHIVPIHVRL